MTQRTHLEQVLHKKLCQPLLCDISCQVLITYLGRRMLRDHVASIMMDNGVSLFYHQVVPSLLVVLAQLVVAIR